MRRTARQYGCWVALLALPTLSCGIIKDPPSWREQLAGTSPCYDVDLMDGLDESSTEELRTLYDCLNYNGHFESLRATVDTLETSSRNARPAGVELAKAVNAMPDAGADPFAIAGVLADALQAEDQPIDEMLDVALELIYGTHASDVESGSRSWSDETALKAGLLAPLAPVVPKLSGALLDDDLAAARWLGEALAEPETKHWLRTLGSLSSSTQADVRGPVAGLLPHLGDALAASESPGNDRWSGATGNSLRDVATTLVDGRLMETISEPARRLLDDTVVRTRLQARMLTWDRDGHLRAMIPDTVHLAQVDVAGGSLSSSEDAALTALLRLLHDTNQPMRCSLDLWITSLEVDLGNLAVAIMEVIASWEPDDVQNGVNLIGAVLGLGISEWLLDEIADSGVCSALTPQVAADLEAIDRLGDAEVYDLLVVLIDVLNLLQDAQGGQDHIDDLVDIASGLHAEGGVPALEELVRDLGDADLIEDAMDLLPVFADPEQYGITAGSEPARDFQDLLESAIWLFEPSADGTGWQRMRPILEPMIRADGTWVAARHAGAVLRAPGSQLSKAHELLEPLLAADPELVLLDQVSPLLASPDLAPSLLAALEPEVVASELLATKPSTEHPEVPLAFGGRLIVTGGLTDLLGMVDTLVGELGDL